LQNNEFVAQPDDGTLTFVRNTTVPPLFAAPYDTPAAAAPSNTVEALVQQAREAVHDLQILINNLEIYEVTCTLHTESAPVRSLGGTPQYSVHRLSLSCAKEL
jgi:hypothetical protein